MMTTATRKRRSDAKPKRTVPEIVTEQVIKGLQMGEVPWRRPWKLGMLSDGEVAGPYNFATRHRYSGVNILLAAVYCAMHGYTYPAFASYKQVTEKLGGTIPKGTKGHIITFLKALYVEDKDELGQVKTGTDGKPKLKRVSMLRYYTVFNFDQCEGLDAAKYLPAIPEPDPDAPVPTVNEAIEAMLARLEPVIKYNGSRAFYRPSEDFIGLPKPEQFEDDAERYLTTLHELTHWTGHESRLARLDGMLTLVGNHEYSKEELVAEIGASMCALQVGIIEGVTPNSQAYVNHWCSKLKSDPKMVISASAKATKAYKYIMGTEPVEEGQA